MRNNTKLPVENFRTEEVSMLLDMLLILHLHVLVIASSSSIEEDGSSKRDAEHSKGSSHQHHWGYHVSVQSVKRPQLSKPKATKTPSVTEMEKPGSVEGVGSSSLNRQNQRGVV